MSQWPGMDTDAFGDYVQVIIDRALYTDAAIFKTAYWLTDRFHIYLDTLPHNRLRVELRTKGADSSELLSKAAGEFCSSLIDHRVRAQVLAETSDIRHSLVAKAFIEGVPPDKRSP